MAVREETRNGTKAPAERLDVEWRIHTPEHHSFACRPAGPLPRAIARAIDLFIQLCAFIVLAIGLAIVGGEVGYGLVMIAGFLVNWFYGAYFEAHHAGRTPGKKAMNLRVISQDGGPATGPSCIIRNFLFIADFMPAGFAAGLTAMAFSSGFRRLGDLAAGTLVIHDESRRRETVSPVLEKAVLQLAMDLPPGLSLRLPTDVQRVLTAYVAKRGRFHPSRRQELALIISKALSNYLGQPAVRTTYADAFVCAVQLASCYPGFDLESAFKHLSDGEVYNQKQQPGPDAWRGYMGRRKEQAERSEGDPAFSPLNRPARWAELETLLNARGSYKAKSYAERLSSLTRSVGADLSLADAYHLPDNVNAYLQDLVAKAHLQLYHGSGNWLRRILDMIGVQAPRILYRDSCLRIAAVAFFGIFALCILLGAVQPQLPQEVLGQGMIEQLESMYANAPRDRDSETASMMTGYYISHNIGIAFICFATGIFLGLGSLILLAYNGVVLGLVFGHMIGAAPPIDGHFFEFVTAHGPFELTGIAMAGAAGLRMGWGLVQTNGLPRLASLRKSAAEAIPIVASAAVLIGLAAIIEAFVSPSALPYTAKASVGIICVVLLIGYLGGLGYLQDRAARDSS